MCILLCLSVLYVQESWDGEPEKFLDPNELAPDGTISIKNYAFSEDSSLLAYMLSKNGSDWCTIKVSISIIIVFAFHL